jgi:hypothetical protein
MTATTRRALAVLGIALVLLYPAVYIGMYAGDAEIHLVYAENAAAGDFFKFNRDEKSSGVTSTGYMLILAAFFSLAPDSLVPVIVKATNLLAWYALAALVYLAARRILDSSVWAYLAALAAGLIPGSAYNSTIGMENGMFGALVMLFFYLAVRWDWMTADGRQDRRKDLALWVVLGLAAWLRPEGVALGGIVFAYAALVLWRDGSRIAGVVSRLVAPSAAFAALVAAMTLFHLWATGDLLPSSGLSRVILSRAEAISLGPLWFTTKFSERMLYYPPLTGAWLLGNWLLLTGRWRPRTPIEPLLLIVFWAFFAMYSTVLGSVHLARYVIFLMPMLVIVGAIGAKCFWETLSAVDRADVQWLKVGVFALGAAGLMAIFAVETGRRRDLGSHDALAQAMEAPGQRAEFSDRLMAELGNPTDLPVSLAYQEVQARYRLDDRFVVRSLDGRVDKTLLDYVEDGNYDHLGYIKERGVDFIMETANYNRDRSLWSLSRLGQLEVGEELERDGVVLRRLPGSRYRVVSIAE